MFEGLPDPFKSSHSISVRFRCGHGSIKLFFLLSSSLVGWLMCLSITVALKGQPLVQLSDRWPHIIFNHSLIASINRDMRVEESLSMFMRFEVL